jgi:hypothetical protein
MAMENMNTIQVNQFKSKYIKMWWDTPATFPQLDKIYSSRQQMTKQSDMNAFIDRMVSEIKRFPAGSNGDSTEWSAGVRDLIRSAGSGIMELTDGCMDILLDGGFCKVTSDFINTAREFDQSVRMDDIMQAMRNVWIMNSIQLLLGMDVKYTTSLFAYSMLYPYTDNYLDAPDSSLDEKRKISAKFRLRLDGQSVEAINSYESALYKLVGMIEAQYPRKDNHQVYASILAIHDAQQESLLQQYGNASPYETDIMGISFEKGGTSVLTDAYLAKGELSEAEAAFMYGFGIFLQLTDDAQDAKIDLKNGHMTMFSQTAGKWPLDIITNRLFNFTYNILDSDSCFFAPGMNELKNVIRNNCTFLLFGAIAHNREMYSKSYIERMEKHSPFGFQYMQQLYKRIGKEYGKLSRKTSGRPMDAAIAQALTQ